MRAARLAPAYIVAPALVLSLAACRNPRDDVRADAAAASVVTATASAQTSPHAAAPSTVATAAQMPPPTPQPPPPIVTDWCIDGLTALDEETCYVLPIAGDAAAADADARPRALLVYLHGIVPPTPVSPQKERVQLAVLHAARRANAAALVPRGLRGIGPGDARDWWAWPTEPGAHGKHAATLVAKWGEAKRRLEKVAGAPFERTYLAGSSNGAYFLTALALRGDLDRLGFPVDGYAAISGGSPGGRAPSSLPSPARPFYVGYGTYDEETKPGARALAALLVAAHWPTRAAEHPFAHGARQEYLDEAFAFWGAN